MFFGLTVLLEEEWNKELQAAELRKDKKPRLWKALRSLSPWYHYVTILLLASFRLICNLLQPVLLSFMLSTLMEAPANDKYMAYIYGLGICLSALGLVFAQVHYEFQASLVAMRIRTALVGLLYKKALRLPINELQRSGTGNLMNLVTNDVERFRLAIIHLPSALLTPLESAVAFGLLCWLTGWPSLFGALMVLGFIVFQLLLATVTTRLRGKAASLTDKRVTLTREIISGIRAVKMYTWEEPYKEFVLSVRRKERKFLVRINLILAAFETLFTGIGRMVLSFVSLMALLLSGHVLTPVNIFLVLTTITAIKTGIFMYLTNGLRELADCRASAKRLETFLLKSNESNQTSNGELKIENCFEEDDKKSNSSAGTFVDLHNVTCSYDGKILILSDVSFKACERELVLISGPVGSGKSSILDAIIGELPVIDGTIDQKGTVAYVPQIPWVFSGTLRDNIVFHQPFDYRRYRAAIKACELENDLKALPNGDMTVVGERGVVLSGGQRSRVNLARAVYSDSNIYLLDDPLSAVDTKVGRRIFENAICGLLRNRIRLLVTHHQQYQKHCDKVINLDDGRIVSKEMVCGVESNCVSTENDNKKYDCTEIHDHQKAMQESEKFNSLKISEEDRSLGHVSWRTYLQYVQAAFPLPCGVMLLLFVLIALVSTVLPDWWISHWTAISWASSRDHTEIVIYIALVGASTVLVFVQSFLVLQAAIRSSTNIHNKMLDAVIKAPVLFFDTNPTGRILNRFTKDIGVMDELLPYPLENTMPVVFTVVVGFTLPSLANYWVAVFALPLLAVCFFFGRKFIRVSRETTRLQAINYSSLLSHISDTLDGLAIIRTHHKQEEFTNMFYRHQDSLSQAWFAYLIISRWLCVRTNVLCFVLLTLLVLCSFLTSKSPGLIGLSVMYASQMLDCMDWAARSVADLENYMTSVERALVYTAIEPEPGYNNNKTPQEKWPQNGSLTFDGVSEVYYDGGPLALKDISFKVEHAEKIGIVGRTGAGKSSLVASLMRMPEPRGNIFIDGVDIKSLNLTASRQVISVIPQNPVLFSGTLRRNIDPFGIANDFNIFCVLDDVHLRDAIDSLEGQLDYHLTEGGSNFSVGERQLICLARALLQGNKIIVMDEATANVDYKTDQLIQETIRDKFKECTVLTIAHRVNTVMDYDRILVLHQGRLVETGRPSELLEKSDSVFAQLCAHAKTT